MSESTNPQGSDNARPFLDDEAWESAYAGEPDEDEESPEVNEADENFEDVSDDGTDSEDDDEADEETNEESEDDDSEDGEDEAKDASDTITLESGEEVTLKQVEEGMLREADYRRKTQEVSNQKVEIETERADVREQYSSLQQKMDNLVSFLAQNIPPEPPLELATTNPTEHYQMMQVHRQAVSQLEQVLSSQSDVESSTQQLNEQDLAKVKKEQRSKLLDHMPHLNDPTRETQFHEKINETAEFFGFSKEEIERNGPLDERVLRSLHFAGIGLESVAKRKAARKKMAVAKKSSKGGTRTGQATDRMSRAVKQYRKTGNTSARDAAVADYWSTE